ncbi:hypothetical protein KPSA1_01037 [Pseudomonas syringae pv. actinidiae]|uniref:Uncharacterized protein n=1 Tax=Pseudomonas syringae pv. actinidiae TaxID=103796 RepID=A0A2V0Q660_PSESF|nr:hypothetical protein KPSA1_01037 [Pseudomonas syringae pv. actinidiae]
MNAGCLYKQTPFLDCTQALSVIGYPRRRRSTGFYRFQALEPSACRYLRCIQKSLPYSVVDFLSRSVVS